MKKLIILTLVAIMMTGCKKQSDNSDVFVSTSHFPIVLIDPYTGDSCEYYRHFGHKGNCRFCAERRRQELKELIKQLK